MSLTTVSQPRTSARFDWSVIAAFFAIYVLWGSTFLAIRITVLLIPPWFSAGIRFFTAGTVLVVFARLTGTAFPVAREWRNLALLGFLMFSLTYGALFWGEQFVPSGVTSVLEATIPLLTVLLEALLLREQKISKLALAAILVGFAGVIVMVSGKGGASFPVSASLVILGGSLSWSLGSVLTRRLPLPSSRVLTAGSEMMLGGAGLLAFSALSGELQPFPSIPLKAAWALLYLITAGSLIGFTAFVWLLARMPASRVASHAYVNPAVAIALGYFFAGEQITLRTIVGAALVVTSVALTLRRPRSLAS
jgi:drug/metabolite transporter (DMT)-like permease